MAKKKSPKQPFSRKPTTDPTSQLPMAGAGTPIANPEDYRLSLPGLEIAFHREAKAVYIVDTTGGTDIGAVQDLLDWYQAQGWFLHYVLVKPTGAEEKRKPDRG